MKYVNRVIAGDCLDVMSDMPNDSVDCVVASPPYGNQRRYGSTTKLFDNDDHWLDWAATRFMECLRVCRGSVNWVVEGYLKNGTFHPLPEMLTVELMKRGANIRTRNIYKRIGIMGGSPDELAQHHEIVVRASAKPGRLPFAEPTATGHPPKCKPGGRPSHQSKDGRVNRPRLHSARVREYKPPDLCKASNVIDCGAVGGGNMGSKLAHENEAPFPEELAEVLIRTYCPRKGIVLDTFCGSGTTLAIAVRHGRGFIGIDNRQSQVDLSVVRVTEEMA